MGDFDTLTEYIHREMIANAQGNQALFIRSFLSRPSTVPQAYANWAALVRPGGIWDHKSALSPLIADNPSQHRFNGVQAEWYAHSFKAYGSYRYDVWSNVHFGFVGTSAGFSADVLADGAGVAQLNPGSWDSVWSTMQNGGLPGMRRYDDPADQSALMLGIHLFQRYGTGLTLDQLRYEVLRWPDLARSP